MYNIVKIGDKEIPMLSMASVDIYYRQIFREDPLKIQAKPEEVEPIGFFSRMAFVMAMFAEKKSRKGMLELTEENYLDWMDQFERDDLINAMEDVQLTYNSQQISTSTAKKKEEEPSVL